MTLDWTPLADLIANHERFLVTTHVRPDGDALGSEIGLAGILAARGRDVRIVNVSSTPPRYDYLDPLGDRFQRFNDVGAHPGDLADRQSLVILDLSSWSQLADMADFVRSFAGPRLVIDHHVSQDDLGAVMLKDATAESTGTLVLRAARALKVPLEPTMATGLLTAIAMDTGWLRHPSTTPETLRDVAELVEAGADLNGIHRQLFERNSLSRVRLMGEAMAGLRTTCDGRVAYASVTRKDLERTGAIPQDTEDLVDATVSLRGVEVGLLFIELRRGGIKLSVRSREGFDCARLAARFGGGGHRAAAGANLPDPLDEQMSRVVEAVCQELSGQVEPAQAL
jgi:phosphoesterase RecJ-like protein